MNNVNDKHKAFLGALISGVVSIGSGLASSIIGRNRAKRQLRRQQIAQNKADTYEMAQNLSEGYSNQDYVDNFQNKIEFKNGGRFNDRIKVAKSLKGTKKKFDNGGNIKVAESTSNNNINNNNNNKWSSGDTDNTINGISSAIGSLLSSVIGNSIDPTIKRGYNIASTSKNTIKVPDYVTNSINSQYLMKCGGKTKKYKKIRK